MIRPENWTNAGPSGLPVPLNISWHLWPDCDLTCTYCYATFRDIPKTLTKDDALRILDLFREAGTEKFTFVGGEPLMCPYIEELIAHAKRIGLVTMLVTNGTRLVGERLHRIVPLLDWVSLSIDASTPELMAEMGRGNAAFWKHCIRCWNALSDYPHLRLKINTVVTKQNKHDDMRALIRELRPARWKVFQVLPVKGQNDGKVEPLLISADEYGAYVARHRELDAEGLGPVAEDNRALTGTYLMLDAMGRLFSNKTGHHVYTDSVLDVGVWESVRQVGWDVDGFLKRGGVYEWKHDDVRPASEVLVPLKRKNPR